MNRSHVFGERYTHKDIIERICAAHNSILFDTELFLQESPGDVRGHNLNCEKNVSLLAELGRNSGLAACLAT